MSGGEVRYERVGAAAVLTIDRPGRRNAVDGATAKHLRQGFEDFEADAGARVLVLTGAGGESFCAGADLKALDLDVDDAAGPMGFSRLTPSKPAIAAVDGWCLAGGLELALWCDLRIATAASTFGFFERRWGVPLVDGGTQRLPRVVGLGRALELILTGRPVDAEEALRIGLVADVIDHGGLLERALEAASQIAALAPFGVRLTKRGMWAALEIPSEQAAIEYEDRQQIMATFSRGVPEAVSAFLEKRPAEFAD